MRINSIQLIFLMIGMLLCKPITGLSMTEYKLAHVDLDSRQLWSAYLHRQMLEFTQSENIPNAAIAFVSDDKIQLLQGYGFANMGNQIAVDPQKHLFRTGSVAKIFTWTAIMQLYEQGLVDLNADINQYLDFELKSKVLYKTKNPEPITLSHLMTHSAGFEDVLQGLFSFDSQPSLKEYLIKNSPARIFPPATVMAYSNYGTALAGYIVEQVSGLQFEDYVEKNIFQPLGMNNSSFQQPLPEHLEKDFVTPYRFVQGEYQEGNFEHFPVPAGGLSASAFDMALFMMAHLNGGTNETGQFLEPETLAQMYKPVMKYHPALSGMARGFMVSELNGYKLLQHGGSSSVFDAGFYLLPGLNMGIFIVYSGGDYAGHIGVFRDFMNEFFTEKSTRPEIDSPLSTPDIVALKGEYHQSRQDITGANRIVNLMMGRLHLKLNQEDQIVFNLYDHDYVYEEVSPGIYRSALNNTGYPFGAMEYIMATHSPDGRIMLVTDGPMTYIKARWYETAAFAGLVFVPALVLAFGSILFIPGRFLYRNVFKKVPTKKNAYKNQNRIIIVHALSLMILLLLFAASNNPHPVHLLPESFFRPNPLMDFMLMILTFIVAGLGILAGWSAIQTWNKRMPGYGARIYYTIYGIWAAGLVWLFWFYNLLSI